MSEFTIYSIGDSAFLEQVLISVAMLVNQTEFQTAAIIIGMLAVILTGFTSIANKGKEFDVSTILVGIILFLGFFVPKTTVLIEDTVTGQVRVVDEVPFAIGVTGGVISQLGYGLSEMFEQGYSLVGTSLTSGYFAESLVVLSNLRKNAYNTHVLNAMNEDTGTDINGDMVRYVKECLAPSLQIKYFSYTEVGGKNIFKIFEEGSTAANSHGTAISTDLSGSLTNVTCSQAYTSIKTRMTDAVNSGPNTRLALGSATGSLSSALNVGVVPSDPSSAAYSNIEDAMAALNISSISGQEYMQAIILDNALLQGVDRYYASVQDFTNRNMLNQAIEQRNTQWSTEQSLFMSTVRPLQAFFESLVYAITPFVAVLLLAGKIGYSIAGKYLLSLIWIQLWFPMLSIINMFIYMGATREFAQFSGESSDILLSQYGLNTANQIAQTWVATGGMLAASTPVIALFLVTGSVYTMNSIAGRMSSSGHIDPKHASPDLRNSPPVLQSSAQHQGDHRGVIKSGMESNIPVFSTSVGEDLNRSSAKSKSEQASNAFTKSLGTAIGDSVKTGTTFSKMEKMGDTISSSYEKGFNSSKELANSISRGFGANTQESNALQGALAAGWSVGANAAIGFKGEKGGELNDSATSLDTMAQEREQAGDKNGASRLSNLAKSLRLIQAGVSGSLSASQTATELKNLSGMFSTEDAVKAIESAREASSNASAFKEGLSYEFGRTNQDSSSADNSYAKDSSVKEAAEKSYKAGKEYRESSSSSASSKWGKNIDGRVLAANMKQGYGEEGLAAMQQQFSSSENSKITRDAANYSNYSGLDSGSARALAIADHLYNNKPEQYNQMLHDLHGITQPNGISSSEYSNLREPSHDGLSNEVKSKNDSSMPDISHNKNNLSMDYVNNQAQIDDSMARRDNAAYQMGQSAAQIGNVMNNMGDPVELNAMARTLDKSSQLIDDFIQNPNFANGYSLFKHAAQSSPSVQGIIDSKNLPFAERISQGLESLSESGNEIIKQVGLDNISESLGLGNEETMYNYAKNNLGLNETQSKYYAATQANFGNTKASEARSNLHQESFDNAYKFANSKGIKNEEDKVNFANQHADSVISRIDTAASFGEKGSIITKPLSALNEEVVKYNQHENDYNRHEDYLDKNMNVGGLSNNFSSGSEKKTMINGENVQHSPINGQYAVMPLDGSRRITSEYGSRTHPVTGEKNKFHHGIDLSGKIGDDVFSSSSGVISRIAYQPAKEGKAGAGHWIEVDHGGGWTTRYMHLNESPTKLGLQEGKHVDVGQKIGELGNTGGSTGPHLDYSIRKDGKSINPRNFF